MDHRRVLFIAHQSFSTMWQLQQVQSGSFESSWWFGGRAGKRETVAWQGDIWYISCFRCFRQLDLYVMTLEWAVWNGIWGSVVTIDQNLVFFFVGLENASCQYFSGCEFWWGKLTNEELCNRGKWAGRGNGIWCTGPTWRYIKLARSSGS